MAVCNWIEVDYSSEPSAWQCVGVKLLELVPFGVCSWTYVCMYACIQQANSFTKQFSWQCVGLKQVVPVSGLPRRLFHC